MDHTLHQGLGLNELTEDLLLDAVIYGPEDEKVGTVSDVRGTGPGAKVIVDVGGFLGIGAKSVALPAGELSFMRDEDGVVHATTAMTKDSLKNLPEYDH